MDRERILTNRVYYNGKTDVEVEARQRCMDLCKGDIVFFVNHYGWCFEPRTETEFPIVLYDYQAWALRDWREQFDNNTGDIVIEKTRDMGITWLLMFLLTWFWLFRPNSNFLISSFREQEVDFQGSMSTLFPKLRFIVDHLPWWMVPKGYNPKQHATYMRLFNPENHSVVIGSAPVPNFGRGGRYKAILFDEFAQWEFGDSAWDAASQSTRIRIALSTPYGRDNRFAKLATDPENVRVECPDPV